MSDGTGPLFRVTHPALFTEDAQGRTVLPMGAAAPPGYPSRGDIAAQLAGVEHAAGVRRSL